MTLGSVFVVVGVGVGVGVGVVVVVAVAVAVVVGLLQILANSVELELVDSSFFSVDVGVVGCD